eukprot:TRINITY_DN20539_c0_g2_i1.p1 TRINITY_DN20539_c0_g2~~TRINITY_DN20539_c0_g2_i1.p1  ORF type:complete len:923 (+),score=258.27 TRINITY_DN20539_c0_g2_i1:84-2852(+)
MSGSLRIRVIEGRQMIPMDTTGYSDPFVKVKFQNEEKQTKVCARTLNPKWDAESFVFLHKNKVNKVTITVYDHDKVGSNDFMGMAELTFGAGLPNSDSIWLPLKPRPDNADDKALLEKYGGMGEVKIDYSHTYFALSKYLASDHLLDQLENKTVGKPAKKKSGTADLDIIERDLARLAIHARNFTAPLLWLRDHISGYKIVYEEGEGGTTEKQVVLIDDHRMAIFAAVTMVAILGYVPYFIAERLSRAALPAVLLVLFRRGASYKREDHDEKQNPFLFLQSPACFQVFFGVDTKVFEKRFIGKAVGAVGNVAGVLTGAVGNVAGVAAGAVGNVAGAVGTLGNTVAGVVTRTRPESIRSTAQSRLSYMSHQTTSDLSEPEDGVDFEYTKPTAEELKTSTNNMAPYVGLAADKAVVYHQVISWQRQHTAESVLKRAILFFLILLFVPTPPLAPALWCIFTYFFFINRLYHTNNELYNRVNVGNILQIAANAVEWVVRRLAGMEDRVEVADDLPAATEKTTFSPGDKVEVTYEAEQADGVWKECYAEGKVVHEEGHLVVVDWNDGSPLFKIEKGHVRKIIDQERPPFVAGETVKVSYEKEEPNGEWNMAHSVGTVIKMTEGMVEVEWGDGSPSYLAPVNTVEKQVAAENEDHSKLQVGKQVHVKIEVETETGDWELKEEIAKLHAIEANEAVVDWEDDGSLYRCSLDFVRPVGSSSASDDDSVSAESRDFTYEPAEGHIVSVSYDQQNDEGAWEGQQSEAEIVDVHEADNKVTVRWTDGGEVYTCGLEHVKFVSEIVGEDFKIGARVIVNYEKELEDGSWIPSVDIGTIDALEEGSATIKWDEADSALFKIPTKNLKKIDTTFRTGTTVAFSCEAELTPSSWTTTTETAMLVDLTSTTATLDLSPDNQPGEDCYETPVEHLISVI